MSGVKRIPAKALEVGMYITEISDAWAADSHLKAQGMVTREETVSRIQGLGVHYLYIDTDKGSDSPEGVPIEHISRLHERELQKLQQEARLPAPTVDFATEKKQADKIRTKALSMVGDLMLDVKKGNKLNVAGVEDLAYEVVESLTGNHNALASLLRLRKKDQYLLEHSFSVSVLMGMLARSMGYTGDALQPLVTGALLHDIGKIRVPDSILHKPGRLEAEEWEEMKRHVNYGMEALADTPGISDTAKLICAQHHERLDGTGYPFQLPADEISVYGRMGAVVDVYDAITADRVYHQGMAPTIALRKMLEWSNDHLDRDLVYQLIRCISIYPPGAMVLLKNGHLAVVQEINAMQQAQPIVQLVYDTSKRVAVPSRVVDLSDEVDLTQFGEVIKAVEPGDYGLQVSNYL
jgi:putative nucleotidyltransferase with HDIG domain